MENPIEKILAVRFVPVFYDPSAAVCATVMQAACRAGLPVFEMTNRGAAARDNFLFLKKEAAELGCSLGIGTVLSATDARFFMENGADFVVSPCFVEEVFEECRAAAVPYLPGCQTIRELFDCRSRGLSLVKIFPGEVVGPAFVRAAKAVFPDLKTMVTGGVSPGNARDWLAAGADTVGIGSAISVVLKNSEEPEEGLFQLFDGLKKLP